MKRKKRKKPKVLQILLLDVHDMKDEDGVVDQHGDDGGDHNDDGL